MGIPGALVQLARDFQEAGVRLYGVGGMVRNPRLGLPISDMDITSALRPEGVLALCEGKGYGVVKKGLAFGMVEIHLGATPLSTPPSGRTPMAREAATGPRPSPFRIRWRRTPSGGISR